MKRRIITGLVALPIAVIPLLLGHAILIGLIFIVSIIGLYEFYKAYNIRSTFLKAMGYVLSIIYYYYIVFEGLIAFQVMFGAYILILLAYYVITYPKYDLKEIAIVCFGYIYIPYLLSHVALIRIEPKYGAWFVWLIFIVAFGSDTCAYFTGRLFGKRKLAKQLSPNKTVEGAIGGVIGSVLLCVLFGIILMSMGKFNNDSPILILLSIIGLVGSVLSQIGDLAASAIKRQVGIKDFGNLLPGHGGLLDRLDSILFTAPFIYYIMQFFI